MQDVPQVTKHHPRGRRRQQRGAAFLIAIAILVILVAIGTTFFSVSRLELKTATNVTNTVRVDLLNDAANAIAVHHLNQYFFRSPEITSSDHSFKSLFNGSFAVGKSWARRIFRDLNDPNPLLGRSLLQNGLPEIDINRIQRALDTYAADQGFNGPVVLYWPEDGHRESLFRGARSHNWLYIPRAQNADTGAGLDPFNPPRPDHIIFYDFEGDVNDLRSGRDLPLDDVPRPIQLRVEDGAFGGLGSPLAQTPAQLNALNAYLDNTAFGDLSFFYFSDLDPYNTGSDPERKARYPFVTAAIYKSRNNPGLYGEFAGTAFNPFAAGYPEEQVDAWADVDNDGDGLRDSIWMPIPQDEFLPGDQIDNDLDGLVDETQDNGSDEDQDGRIDYLGFDNGQPQEDPLGVIMHDEDEAIEAGTLVYNGMGPLTDIDGTLTRVGDGLDNDGDGIVDEQDEDRLFLTAPLPGVRVPIDLDGDGIASTIETYRPYDPITGDLLAPPYQVVNPVAVIGPTIELIANGGLQTLGPENVDAIDNDYDLLVNDFHAYAYIGPYQPGVRTPTTPLEGWQPVGNWGTGVAGAYQNQIVKSFADLDRRVWGSGTRIFGTRQADGAEWFDNLEPALQDAVENSLRITHSGEPACTLVGRAAIEIADEASKINLNVAGAESFNPFKLDGIMAPAFNEGLGPHEYDLMTLPVLQAAVAPTESMASIVSKIAGYRTGGHGGRHLSQDVAPSNAVLPTIGPWQEQFDNNGTGDEVVDVVQGSGAEVGGNVNAIDYNYAFDVSLPGLGRVDDNGNALISAIDGLDNDGNGILDEGFVSEELLPAEFDEVLAYRNGTITALELGASGDTTRFQDPAQLAFAIKWFRMGTLEGVDEPGERQLFSPLRNTTAESDLLDNNPPLTADVQSFTDEVGELGDRNFQSETEVGNIANVGEGTANQLARLTTVHSSDRNVNFIPTETGVRALNATDLNRATAKQLGAKLLLGNEVVDSLRLIDRLEPFDVLDNAPLATEAPTATWGTDATAFAEGLRQGDIRLLAHDPRPDAGGEYRDFNDLHDGGFLFDRQARNTKPIATAAEFPLDQQLQYMQLAVNIADSRDAGHARSQLTTERVDRIAKTANELGLQDDFGNFPPGIEWAPESPVPGDKRVRNWPAEASPIYAIDEEELFPLEELEDHLADVMNAGDRKLQITDRWWMEQTANLPTGERPEQRHISYTAAGVESIRINELMVRPVRRVEAEAFPESVPAGTNATAFINANPDLFATDPLADTSGVNPPFQFNYYMTNLDPSPFSELLLQTIGGPVQATRIGNYPHPATASSNNTIDYVSQIDPLTPEFRVRRQTVVADYDGTGGLDGTIALADSRWGFNLPAQLRQLGEDTYLTHPGFAFDQIQRVWDTGNPADPEDTAPILVPDILEFVFSEPNHELVDPLLPPPVEFVGLPDGRYYLAIKLENFGGAESLADVIGSGRLRYSIKYRSAFANENTITQDVIDLLDDINDTRVVVDQTQAYNDYALFLSNNFRSVPAAHLANGPGERPGWVFLDATPNPNGVSFADNYFIDFPASFHVDLLNAGAPVARVRVYTQFLNGQWRVRMRGGDLPGVTGIRLTGPAGVQILPKPGDPTATEMFLRGDLTDAEFRQLLAGDTRIEVTYALGTAAGDVVSLPNPDDYQSSHAISVPAFPTGYEVSVAITTSPFPVQAGGLGELPADAPGGAIGVNFFDFSQEPDHEYIELANVSDDIVDLSNWTLEVGPRHREGIDWYPFNTEWRVPDQTFIAPGGMVLLTFNKFDSFDNIDAEPTARMPSENLSLIQRNGMGMARTVDFGDIAQNSIPDIFRITVPPIADNASDNSLYNRNETLGPVSFYSDLTGSVFSRDDNDDTNSQYEMVDYIDDYGAGVTTAFAVAAGVDIFDPDGNIVPDQERVALENAINSSGSPRPNFPWDRIIEMENVRLWQTDEALLDTTNSGNVHVMTDIDDVDMLARFVLRGGALPNYPDHDGIDNDGDGGYITSSGTYVPGVLEEDMFDNDLDGFVDERVQNLSFDAGATVSVPFWPFSNEGVDEGNLGLLTEANSSGPIAAIPYRPYGAGSLGFGTLPAIFNPSRQAEDTFFLTTTFTDPAAATVDGANVRNVSIDAMSGANPENNWNVTPPGAVTFSPGLMTVSNSALTTAVLLPADTTSPGGQTEFLANRQLYVVELIIPSFSSGRIQVFLGDDTSIWEILPTTVPSTGRVFQNVMMASFDSTSNAPQTLFRMRFPVPTVATISGVNIYPVGTSNQHGESFAFGMPIPNAVGNANQAYANVLTGSFPAVPADALYLGSDLDPPDWKAFVERRMYPGDNVIVSLYDASGDLADRVTYREYDVINRTIDDVVGSPYVSDLPGGHHDYQPTEGMVLNTPADAPWVSLHPDYPTFWLPNHMGLDFYRALERKNPLSPGDRFGTENRWQATDGNYDDWADSLSVFARYKRLEDGTPRNEYAAFPNLASQYTTPDADGFLDMSRFFDSVSRDFTLPGQLNVEDHLRLYGHALWGSPLRMNTAYRKVQNPVDPVRITGPATALGVSGGSKTMAISQFMTAPRIEMSPDFDNDTGLEATLWQNRRATTPVANEPYVAPMEMALASMVTQEHYMQNVAPVRLNPTLPNDTFLHDTLSLNYYTTPSQLKLSNDVAQRSALAGQAEELTEGSQRPMSALLKAGSTDSLVLTVGQANFVPIRPDVDILNLDPTDPFPNGQNFQDLLNWRPVGANTPMEPPAAWTPVFLMADPTVEWNTASATNPLVYPYYPPRPNGQTNGPWQVDNRAFIFPPSLMFGTEWQQALIAPPAVMSGPLAAFHVMGKDRVPLEKRVVMYVSKNRLKNPSAPMTDLNASPATRDHRPDGLWVWDAEDGLENGEYEVYIGTWLPALSRKLSSTRNTVDAMEDAAESGDTAAEELLANITLPAPTPLTPAPRKADGVITPFAQLNLAERDPILYPNGSAPFTAEYEIDVLTEPTDALGLRPCVSCDPSNAAANMQDTFGLVYPEDWQPNMRYRARDDGYIFYGTDAASGWQPIIVRVTNNFLALRVRNVGTVTQTGAVSHIVLSPRKRTPGRININTAGFLVADTANLSGYAPGTASADERRLRDGRKSLVHPLAGLPGVRTLGGEAPVPFDVTERFTMSTPLTAQGQDPADVNFPNALPEPAAMTMFNGNNLEAAPLGILRANNFGFPDVGGPRFNAIPPAPSFDGFYNTSGDTTPEGPLAPLADFPNRVQSGRYLMLSLMQLGRTEHQDGRYYDSIGDLISEDSAFFLPEINEAINSPRPDQPVTNPLYPLSNNMDAETRAREMEERMRRIANSITVRSDVFEIITTVQAGYGLDANNDGHFNYRDNNEFITTSETRSRMVYERRVPADSSDEADVSKQ